MQRDFQVGDRVATNKGVGEVSRVGAKSVWVDVEEYHCSDDGFNTERWDVNNYCFRKHNVEHLDSDSEEHPAKNAKHPAKNSYRRQLNPTETIALINQTLERHPYDPQKGLTTEQLLAKLQKNDGSAE